MRQPSTLKQKWEWWELAVSGQAPPIHEDDPQAGFFAVRKFPYGEWPKGPLVPAKIWWESEIDPETNELLSDERLRGDIDGKPINPWSAWTWLAARPISEREWEYLTAMSPLLPKEVPPRRASNSASRQSETKRSGSAKTRSK